MAVQINEAWRATGEAMNVTLERRVVTEKGDKAGQVKWVAEGYYPSVEAAYKGMATRRVNVALDSEFWQVLKLQKEILAEIKALGGGE